YSRHLGSFKLLVGKVSPTSPAVIPAKAGTQLAASASGDMDPSFRWDDIECEDHLVCHTRTVRAGDTQRPRQTQAVRSVDSVADDLGFVLHFLLPVGAQVGHGLAGGETGGHDLGPGGFRREVRVAPAVPDARGGGVDRGLEVTGVEAARSLGF